MNLTNVGGVLYFVANDGVSNFELWRSNGTEAGTVLVKNLAAGAAASYPQTLTNVSGVLYFTDNSYRLWRSDGTEVGTTALRQFHRPSKYLTNVNGTLFFSGMAFASSYRLWKSDGTVAGTVLVDNGPANIGTSFSYPSPTGVLANVAGTLYFTIVSGSSANGELWRSDGTAAGTTRVLSIRQGGNISAGISHLTNVGGRLYFRGNDGVSGPQLWRSDGTAGATTLVPVTTGGPLRNPTEIMPVGERMFVIAGPSQFAAELYSRVFVPNELFPIQGDYDQNRIVDLADEQFWRSNFAATTGVGLQADGNLSGVVDAADYTLWRDHYIPPAPVALATTPVSATITTPPLARDLALTPPQNGRPIATSPPRRTDLLLSARDAAFADLGHDENPSPITTHKPAPRKIAPAKNNCQPQIVATPCQVAFVATPNL